MAKIIITNRTERHLQYRIDHQVVCVKAGRCLCKTGRRGAVAMSIHVPGGKGLKTDELPSEIALSPQIRKDQDEGKIEIAWAQTKTVARVTSQKAAASAEAEAGSTETKMGKKSGGGRKKTKTDTGDDPEKTLEG